MRLTQTFSLACSLMIAIAACGDASTASEDASTALDAGADATPLSDATTDAPPDLGPRAPYVTSLPTSSDYERMQGQGGEVKFLLQADGRTPLFPHECVFADTLRYPYHLSFLRENFPGLEDLDLPTYARYVLNQDSRRAWGDHIKHYPDVVNQATHTQGIYGFVTYHADGAAESLTVAQIREVHDRLIECAPFLANQLAFLPNADQDYVHDLVSELQGAGVQVLFPEDLITDAFVPYVTAESYGYLRVYAPGASLTDYGPRDIVAADSAPNEISLVGGLITALPQSFYSHVNLRLREKHIPSAMLATFRGDERFTTLADQLVHVVVTDTDVTLESATLEQAEAHWNATRPTVTVPPSDLEATEMPSLDMLQYSERTAYGVKASNLGELQRALPEANRPVGFAIPFSAYQTFVTRNHFDTTIDLLLANPEVFTNAATRARELENLRSRFRHGDVQPDLIPAIAAQAQSVFGDEGLTTFLRFRSSSNVEDLDALSGAGLYDSASGCLADDLDDDNDGPSLCLSDEFETFLRNRRVEVTTELSAHPDRTWLNDVLEDIDQDLTEERPVEDAVRKVWRSVWNLRAFEERDYYGIDQHQVYMGMAVHPRFVMEQAEAVAVTNLPSGGGLPLYRVVAQVSDIGIVRPVDPGATPEIYTFNRDGSGATNFSTLAMSNRTSGFVLSGPERAELANLLFMAHDYFRAHVYMRDDLRLDIEVEVLPGRRIVLKQARPYLSEE